MATSKLEVLVDLGSNPDQNVLNKTINELKSRDGVKEVAFTKGAFVVETSLPSSEVLDLVAKTSGKRAVLQGFGESQSAVAIVTGQGVEQNVAGVIRFQHADGAVVLDGSVDGLSTGLHGLHVHESGDLSQGCSGLGGHWNPEGGAHGTHAGDLGNVVADETGRATFRIVNNTLKLSDIIGRAVAISERADDLGRGSSPTSKLDGDSGKPIACGIIARSAGVFQNSKRICACDGVVVWDERDRPLAGKGRRGGCCGGEEKGVKQGKSCCMGH